MAFTQGDIDILKAAIVSRAGARSITFSDQSVTFDSVADMLALLNAMQAEVTASAPTNSRTRYAATSKGV
jgi:hypothetical protein